jgi:hypothetical protein
MLCEEEPPLSLLVESLMFAVTSAVDVNSALRPLPPPSLPPYFLFARLSCRVHDEEVDNRVGASSIRTYLHRKCVAATAWEAGGGWRKVCASTVTIACEGCACVLRSGQKKTSCRPPSCFVSLPCFGGSFTNSGVRCRRSCLVMSYSLRLLFFFSSSR